MNKSYLLPQGFVFHDSTNITVTEAAIFIPEIWAQSTLKNIYAKSAMIGAVSKDYSSELAAKGDIVHVQKRGLLHSHPKVANQAVHLNVPDASTVPVCLTDHQEVSFLVEDVAEAQATPSQIDGYTGDAAEVLATDIEDALCAIYTDGDYDAGHDLVWDPSDGDSKYESILALRSQMVVENKLPESAPRYLVIRDLADLLNVDRFVSKDYLETNATQTGLVGQVLSYQVLESSQIIEEISPGGITHRLAFARNAISLVTRRLPDPPAGSGAKGQTVTADGVGMRAIMGYNMDYLGMQCTIDTLFGVKILYPDWVFQLLET